MKALIILTIVIAVGMVTLLMYLKPSNDDVSIAQTINTSSFVKNQQPIAGQNIQHNLDNQAQASDSAEILAHNNENDEIPLFDTKSDFSIEPIDPETDPANEIISAH